MCSSPASSENEKKFPLIITLIISSLTCIVGKPIATRKFAHQLIRTATDMAAGRGPWENSSAVIIQGMEPGPTAKKTT